MDKQVKNNLGYHYTSLSSFMAILDGVKDGNILFHASDVYYMNDPTEIEYGLNEISKCFADIEKTLHLNITEYQLSKLWDKDPRITPDEWRHIFYERSKKYSRHPYIVSYSHCRESLPMWRMYGDNGKGVSLGFDVRIYLEEIPEINGIRQIDMTDVDFKKPYSIDVEYGSVPNNSHPYYFAYALYRQYWLSVKGEKDREKILDRQLETISEMLHKAAPFVKHDAYKYEKESRIIADAKGIDDVKYKSSSSGQVIPYIEIKLPLSDLKEVIVGPCCDYDLTENIIRNRLMQLGIEDVTITKSDVPYRC